MNEVIQIQNLIYTIRNKKVMLDRDLAQLYDVPVKSLNQAVKRNIERFPEDFMFRLTQEEWENLRSQIVTANTSVSLSKIRFTPFVFTQNGILMLANVLNSQRAINMSIQIIRVFEQLRQFAFENQEISKRLTEIEHYLIAHVKDNKVEFKRVYETLNLLMDRTKPSKIGFVVEDSNK